MGRHTDTREPSMGTRPGAFGSGPWPTATSGTSAFSSSGFFPSRPGTRPGALPSSTTLPGKSCGGRIHRHGCRIRVPAGGVCDRLRIAAGTFYSRLFYLDHLFVDEEYRGIGVGGGLLAKMALLAGIRRMGTMLLMTKKNSPAEALYLDEGFKRLLPFIKIQKKIVLYKKLYQG